MAGRDGGQTHNSQAHNSSVVGFATAGTRALTSQIFTFYLRVPVKLFRPTRIDYMALPRALSPSYQVKPWNLFTHSGPALIAQAVKMHGWSFIPHNILPPLIANSAVGLALYTSYLTSLAVMTPKADNGRHHSFSQTLIAGGIAGSVQSLAAAPIDAIVTRFSVQDVIDSRQTILRYGLTKLKEIGITGVFSGFAISLVKEALSYSLYFSTFETVKGSWYRKYKKVFNKDADKIKDVEDSKRRRSYVYPSFVLLAGMLSAVSLQVAHHPLGKIQKLHLIQLEALDMKNRQTHIPAWRLYMHGYFKTFKHIDRLRIKEAAGSWFRWLYSGFWRSTLLAAPSTSIGLIVFEIMRLRYSDGEEPPALTYEDYDEVLQP